MSYTLTWLPVVLKAAGLKVATVDGWQTRGHGDVGETFGVICHHTAGPRDGNMPSLGTIVNGRPDLAGPLAQLGLGRDGTYYVIAAGRCSHAGKGEWLGHKLGNTNFIGIEAEHTGEAATPWPAVQRDAYERGVAAILRHIGRPAEFCAGHKEYALPKGRKPDPNFDMDEFREHVRAILAGNSTPPALIPPKEPVTVGTVARPTLRRGMSDDLVKVVQRKLAVSGTGTFGPVTEAAVRRLQTGASLVPDGIVGPKTWVELDKIP